MELQKTPDFAFLDTRALFPDYITRQEKERTMANLNNGQWLQTIRDELYTAVLSDVLDSEGLRGQVCSSGFFPITSARRIVGRAFPVLTAETCTLPARPYDKLIEALDTIEQDEVFMTNSLSDRAAFWGELLSTACKMRGAVGAIIDGWARDVERIEATEFAVIARGCRPVDSLGRFEVLEYRTPIVCGGVMVNPGDLVMADPDGIVVVPRDIETDIVNRALEKVRGENLVRDGIRSGQSLRTLFNTYGVL